MANDYLNNISVNDVLMNMWSGVKVMDLTTSRQHVLCCSMML